MVSTPDKLHKLCLRKWTYRTEFVQSTFRDGRKNYVLPIEIILSYPITLIFEMRWNTCKIFNYCFHIVSKGKPTAAQKRVFFIDCIRQKELCTFLNVFSEEPSTKRGNKRGEGK